MLIIEGSTINAIYVRAVDRLLKYGQIVERRGLKTREIINVQLVLLNPRARYLGSIVRNMSMKYHIGELCFYLDGRTDLESIAHYGSFWRKVSDDDMTVNSAYGYRLFYMKPMDQKYSQFDYVYDVLVKDQFSNKAVMVIYDKNDSKESKDNPCTLSLQFLIRDNKLYCFTLMRSNDIWLGTPYDIAFFSIVHEILYVNLLSEYPNLRLGSYVHSVTSLHAYEKDFDKLKELAQTPQCEVIKAPYISPLDISSWFNDLLTYEKSRRNKVIYKRESLVTPFQTWCKNFI